MINLHGQNIISVPEGNNVISTAIASAASGDIIELTSNGGAYIENASIALSSKAITIRAAAGLTAQPVVKCNSIAASNPIISLGGSVNLTLIGIKFDSSAVNSAPRFINILSSVTGGVIHIANCTVGNFNYAIYGSSTAAMDSLIINNSVFTDMSGRCLYIPAGSVNPGVLKNLTITNSTFKNMKATEPCIYFYGSATPSYSPSLRINHVTFYNCQRIRTIAAITDVEIKNTIFATDGTISSGTSFYLFGGSVVNSLVFNAPVGGSGATYTNFKDNIDPLFKNASTGDLTLTDASPAINAGDDGTTIGDPRWWPESSGTKKIEAGVDKISAALATAKDGDVLELITDGGLYKETKTLVVNKNVTIKAASSLINKPALTSDDGNYIMQTQSGLSLNGIQLDGLKGALKNVGGIVTDLTGYNLKINNCDFLNFVNTDSTSNHAIFSDRYASQVDSLIISGCTFKNIKDQGIYLGGHLMSSIGSVKYCSIKNSTFSKITADAIYLRDNDGSLATQGPAFVVDHCTFYDAAASYGVLAHYIDSVVVKNSIASYSSVAGKTSYYIYGANSIIKNSLYFNLSINLHTAQSQNVIVADPLFIDAANGNFMLYKNSPAVFAGDDGTTIGDPRWGVSDKEAGYMVFIKKPCAQTPTENSIRVVWETPENAPVGSIVEYGTTKQLGSKTTGSDGRLIAGEGYIHEVTITGLQPFTNYYYRISDGKGNDPDTNAFKTAPAPGTNFRMVGLSDIHDNHQQIWQHMATRIMDFNPDLTFFIGDYVNEGNTRTEWDNGFFTPGRPLLRKTSILPWIGNHETYADSPITFYDYFSLPTHPANGEDTLRDPSGEAYFSTMYGDVKIIAMNANGDDYSPSFTTGSPQLLWLENEISTSTSKWIFIVSHVNVLSSAYHGQWSADQKQYLLPLYEKYAALGKHIMVFGGDEHSFEHLYKAGVNYIRPGCANASNYPQVNLADLPYSIYFKSAPGFSTLDISDGGNIVTLIARDTTGTPIYSASFDARQSTLLPSFYISSPGVNNDTTSFTAKIQWTDWVYETDSASTYANIYYTADSSSTGSLMVENIKLNSPQNSYLWDVRNVPVGTYYIYAVIANGSMSPIKKYALGKVVVVADVAPPPPSINLTGSIAGGKVSLSWVNPTRTVHIDNVIGTFEAGTENFTGENDGTSTGSIEQITGGYTGNGLRINYNVTVAWDQYGGVKKFSGYPDYSSTGTLDFWYKGDGSSNALRIVAKQDNDRNGTSDDWWYNETLSLSSTAWQHAQIDMKAMKGFTWHTNTSSSFDLTNMFSVDFIVPCGTPSSGHVDIDEIKLAGEVLPAPDFQGAIVVRKVGSYPANPHDGTIIYQGAAEACIDSTVETNTSYFYAVFAYDFTPNYSGLDSTSVWKSGLITGIKNTNKIPVSYELSQNYPNPFNPSTTIKYGIPKAGLVNVTVYNVVGQKVLTLVNEFMKEGYYNVEFNSNNILPSGIYFFRIQSGTFTDTKKMILMK